MNRRVARLAPETARVLALTLALGLVSVVVVLGADGLTALSAHPLGIPWWGMAAAFAVTESAVLHVQTRREAQSVSISELPLVVGLFFCEPAELLLGRLLGSLLVLVVVRRSSLLKTTFNTALFAMETVLAVAAFRLLAGDAVPVEPRAQVAALTAVLVANAAGQAALGLVIAVYEGGATVRSVAVDAVSSQLFTAGVAVLGLVAAACLHAGGMTAWVVGAAVLVLMVCYREYSSLFDRHVTLERLYAFSQAVGRSSDRDVVVRRVLDEVRELLTSDHARLVTGSPARVRTVTLSASGDPRTEEAPRQPDWVEEAVLVAGTPVVLPRRSRDRRTRAWLTTHGLRDAVAVPLRGTDGILGMLLVGERLGEVRSYGREDVLLLETVANHASVAFEKSRLIEQLQHDALHDALTGLPNRKHFQQRLSDAIVPGADAPESVAVVILDLDGFKDVNDTLGHHQGDLVLTQIAGRLAGTLGDAGFVARLGGDEFAVLLTGTDRAEGLATCERIVAALQGPITMEGMQFEVGASVGIAHCPTPGFDGSALMKRADLAMYEAKTSGLRICEYLPGSDDAGARRLAIAAGLRAGLAAGDLGVHLQPQQDVRTGEVHGVEALARWTSPTLGTVVPTEFIPVAERSGLIGALTAAVLDTALGAVAGWPGHPVSVAVNVSPRTLLDPSLVAEVRDALERRGVPPERLVLEVTEGAVMTDPDRAIALLHELAGLGVRLSIDDFGTGHSSLSYLRRLPVHEVKIDRSFVSGLASSAEDHAIVRSIISLGTNLGLDVVAEGVEDQETYDLLAAMGCTRVQGWHVARPMPVEAAGAWLAARTARVALAAAG